MEIKILIDSREKSFNHIKGYFDVREITYEIRKLNYGDYSIEINGQSLEEFIFIERKSGLDELCNNFCKGRDRFEREFKRSKGKPVLMIEGATYGDILDHNYKSGMYPKALLRSLKKFEAKFNISTSFVNKRESGNFIYYTLKSYAEEYMDLFEEVK